VREVVKAVIHKDHKYLLQLRDNDPAISYPDTWSLFGGEVDEGESFEEALKRELEEELSWCPDRLICLAKSSNKKVNCNITFYLVHCEVPKESLVLGEGQDMDWYTLEEIISLLNTPDLINNIINKAARHLGRL
jgi:8-oxo-dGTP diphosphatase